MKSSSNRTPSKPFRPDLKAACAVALAAALIACSKDSSPEPTPSLIERTYRMGFSGFPPRPDLAQAIAAIDLWSLRADAAIISEEPPWDSLVAGVPAQALVARDKSDLVNYYRLKGHEIWIYLDPGNGLNRGGESDALIRLGRSITEPAIQALYRRYAVVMDSMLGPAHVGLALETNLIRAASPPVLYQAIRQVANDAAADLRTRGSAAKLSVSVQVDYAWGALGGGPFTGIDQDFLDFPFIEELGLSSYPYLAGFREPEEIPQNYYTRLVEGRTIPVMVTEGGWTSATLDTIISSEEEQKRYIEKQAVLLDAAGAIAYFQLTFTDIDLSAYPPQPSGSILPLFARLGLVDADLRPKAALTAWDEIHARSRR